MYLMSTQTLYRTENRKPELRDILVERYQYEKRKNFGIKELNQLNVTLGKISNDCLWDFRRIRVD